MRLGYIFDYVIEEYDEQNGANIALIKDAIKYRKKVVIYFNKLHTLLHFGNKTFESF